MLPGIRSLHFYVMLITKSINSITRNSIACQLLFLLQLHKKSAIKIKADRDGDNDIDERENSQRRKSLLLFFLYYSSPSLFIYFFLCAVLFVCN